MFQVALNWRCIKLKYFFVISLSVMLYKLFLWEKSVSVSAGTELFFFTVSSMMLCFGFVRKNMLITRGMLK